MYKNEEVKSAINCTLWFISFILIYQIFGVCPIHELGHYLSGSLFGCNTLKIYCNYSLSVSEGGVKGWEYCNKDLVFNGSEKLCNALSLIISSIGFFSTFIFFTIVCFILNKLIKNKIGKYYLEKGYFKFLVLLIFIESFNSSQSDLFKIIDCFNPEFASFFLNNISVYFVKAIRIIVFLPIIIKLFKVINKIKF